MVFHSEDKNEIYNQVDSTTPLIDPVSSCAAVNDIIQFLTTFSASITRDLTLPLLHLLNFCLSHLFLSFWFYWIREDYNWLFFFFWCKILPPTCIPSPPLIFFEIFNSKKVYCIKQLENAWKFDAIMVFQSGDKNKIYYQVDSTTSFSPQMMKILVTRKYVNPWTWLALLMWHQ